jgi:hypothetical protein
LAWLLSLNIVVLPWNLCTSGFSNT